ncbi:MAG: hypothetical protein KKB20_03090 [Proteobacteria bacterium]|nr:hypothetical protein [Pseudomonadota bacterium]
MGRVFARTGFTGGTSNDLDGISRNTLANGNMGIVKYSGNIYVFNYNTASGQAENSPFVIVPDDATGNEAWELVGVKAYMTDSVFLPIDDAIDGTVQAPAAAATITSTNGKVRVRKFDSATDEDVIYAWRVPKDIVAALGIKFEVEMIITEGTAPSSEGAAFFLEGYSIGSGDALNGTHGTAVKSSKTGMSDAQYDRVVTTQSAKVTVTDLAGGELAMLHLYRDVSDADDDYGQDLGVSGVWLTFTRLIGA